MVGIMGKKKSAARKDAPPPQLVLPAEGLSRSVTAVHLSSSIEQRTASALSLLEGVATETLAFAANAPTNVQTQVSRILSVVQKPVVDVLQLRAIVLSAGLPCPRFCAPSLRALVWKLLLGVLPAVRSEWVPQLDEKRKIYQQYVRDLVHEPEQVSHLRLGVVKESPEDGPVPRRPAEDHPLALVDSPSRWRRYWSDQEVFDQVNKDVYRTRPGVDFFAQTGDSRTKQVTPRGNAVTLSVLETDNVSTSPKRHAFKVANIVSPKTHYDRMGRILFLYSKLNCGYVQGMNEILAPIYYALYHDVLEGHFVEADAFWALTVVMTEQRDIFCKNMDDSTLGMYGRLEVIQTLLAREDPQVSSHLSKIGVKMDFFALRWIMLLFAQEFDISAIQVLWDAIFSDLNPGSQLAGSRDSLLVNYVAVAMIRKVRNVLLDGDFGDAMRTLKQYPPFDPKEIIQEALKMRKGGDVTSVISAELQTASPQVTKKKSLSSRLISFVRRKPKNID